jgi:cysteinyl-tRNA synthetase
MRERAEVLDCAKITGLLGEEPSQFLQEITEASSGIDIKEIEILIHKRNQARKAKDWLKADAIRDELSKENIILEDGPKGTSWRFKLKESE